MKSIKLLKKYFRLLGFHRWESKRGRVFGFGLNVLYLVLLLTYFFGSLLYFVFVLKTVRTRPLNYFYVTSSTLMISWYLVHIFKYKNYLELFNRLSEIIERSKKI